MFTISFMLQYGNNIVKLPAKHHYTLMLTI